MSVALSLLCSVDEHLAYSCAKKKSDKYSATQISGTTDLRSDIDGFLSFTGLNLHSFELDNHGLCPSLFSVVGQRGYDLAAHGSKLAKGTILYPQQGFRIGAQDLSQAPFREGQRLQRFHHIFDFHPRIIGPEHHLVPQAPLDQRRGDLFAENELEKLPRAVVVKARSVKEHVGILQCQSAGIPDPRPSPMGENKVQPGESANGFFQQEWLSLRQRSPRGPTHPRVNHHGDSE